MLALRIGSAALTQSFKPVNHMVVAVVVRTRQLHPPAKARLMAKCRIVMCAMLCWLWLQVKLAADPKKQALEMLRKKIEVQNNKALAVRRRYEVAKQVSTALTAAMRPLPNLHNILSPWQIHLACMLTSHRAASTRT